MVFSFSFGSFLFFFVVFFVVGRGVIWHKNCILVKKIT